MRQHLADLLNRQGINHLAQFITFLFIRFCFRESFRFEERKAFHATPFVLHGCMCGIMLRHRRGHMAYDGLNDGKRDACKSGVITERVTARMKILHADCSCPVFRFSRGLNTKPLKELFDPVDSEAALSKL